MNVTVGEQLVNQYELCVRLTVHCVDWLPFGYCCALCLFLAYALRSRTHTRTSVIPLNSMGTLSDANYFKTKILVIR